MLCVYVCMYVCVFAISSANSQQIFIKLHFRNIHEIAQVLIEKKSGKSGFREKTGLNFFPDFLKNGFFVLFCDHKVFFVFQYNIF